MARHLDRDLERIKKQILTIGSLVEEQTNNAIFALVNRREDLAQKVMTGDQAIDDKEVEVEEDCLKILALHQPVAFDLRFIVTVMKVNNDLERVGDLALNIAERAAFLASNPPLEVPEEFSRMAEQVREMVRLAIDSLVNHDTAKAREVCAHDDDVDETHAAMFNILQDIMRKDPDCIVRSIHLLSASRNLERIADLATNIAEDVVFLVDGEVVRHRLSDYLARSNKPRGQ